MRLPYELWRTYPNLGVPIRSFEASFNVNYTLQTVVERSSAPVQYCYAYLRSHKLSTVTVSGRERFY